MPTVTRGHWFLAFPAPDKIWSTNQDRNMHHMQRAALVKAWRDATFWHYRKDFQTKPMWHPALVEVHIPVKGKRRRDPMNYCGTIVKAVIDGLVQAGAWPDDTPEYVRHLEPVLTDQAQVYVHIKPT